MPFPSRTLTTLALLAVCGCGDDARTGGPGGVQSPGQESRAFPGNSGNPSSPDVGIVSPGTPKPAPK